MKRETKIEITTFKYCFNVSSGECQSAQFLSDKSCDSGFHSFLVCAHTSIQQTIAVHEMRKLGRPHVFQSTNRLIHRRKPTSAGKGVLDTILVWRMTGLLASREPKSPRNNKADHDSRVRFTTNQFNFVGFTCHSNWKFDTAGWRAVVLQWYFDAAQFWVRMTSLPNIRNSHSNNNNI